MWHIVSLYENQIDLMAAIYKLAKKLPFPKICGVDIQYIYVFCLSGGTYNYLYSPKSYKSKVVDAVEKLKIQTGIESFSDLANYINESFIVPINNDMNNVADLLQRESKIDYIDQNTQTLIKAKNKPNEPIKKYHEIIDLISKENYFDAISAYYNILGDNYYNELINELIYLKRLAKVDLTGRDLVYFRQESSRNELVTNYFEEYVIFIDETLNKLRELGRKTPLNLLLEYAPSMEDLVTKKEYELHMGVNLYEGKIDRVKTLIILDSFTQKYDYCPDGRFFDKYPDQILHCRVYEYYTNPRFKNLWVTYSPEYIQSNIIEKDLHINYIDAYCHNLKNKYQTKRNKETDFQSLSSMNDVIKEEYFTNGIEFTGKTHCINNKIFYEINLIRNIDEKQEIENPFIELVEEILREAENLLREKHGYPRIGEGWISETRMYQLVKRYFPDAEQHSSPDWLKPQHLDAFIPSQNIAFEYQGRQHYEPIDFLGGEESFQKTI